MYGPSVGVQFPEIDPVIDDPDTLRRAAVFQDTLFQETSLRDQGSRFPHGPLCTATEARVQVRRFESAPQCTDHVRNSCNALECAPDYCCTIFAVAMQQFEAVLAPGPEQMRQTQMLAEPF